MVTFDNIYISGLTEGNLEGNMNFGDVALTLVCGFIKIHISEAIFVYLYVSSLSFWLHYVLRP